MVEAMAPPWSLGWSIAIFVLVAAVTVVASVRMATLGDVLADRTGWGRPSSARSSSAWPRPCRGS
ncbi:hypothetical protein HFP72_33400 [Nocardiopsis sp. ARC36]